MAEKESAPNGQLMDIGTVAAMNIRMALGLAEGSVPVIKRAIQDEISAMSSHFTLAVAEANDSYEMQIRELTGSFNFIKENAMKVWCVAAALLVLGVVVGHFA